MATIQYKGFNKTVETIADRNNLTRKQDHMVVIVKDAIADVNAGQGKATYRYDASDDTWIMISKGTKDTMTFTTEEIEISDGKVQAANVPSGNGIWDLSIVDGDVVIANPRVEDVLVSGIDITGLDEYNGKKFRFTYGYGSVGAQISCSLENVYTKDETETLVDNKYDLTLLNHSGTKGDIYVADGDGHFQKLPIGTDGQILTADSSSDLGLKWENNIIG